jgi:D-amino-acid oxidase
MAETRITVLGAGVIGLSSAVRLAEAGHVVDVLARELPLETTSAVAGGLWLPFLAEPFHLVSRWSQATYRELRALADPAGAAPVTGVALRAGYLLGAGVTHPAWADAFGPELGLELGLAPVAHPAPGHAEGLHLRVPVVDMHTYLPYLVARLRAAGGTLTRLPLTRGLVVNCTGLASRALAADPSVHPIRGQVVLMSNPGLTTWWSDESDALRYVIPHPRRVVVGGTTDDGDWSTDPDDATTARLVDQARDLVPALRSARVLSTRVGLRPARPTVRLETVNRGQGTTIHCYGHGGSGVTLSWGCADDVLAAAEAVLTPSH